MYNICTYSIYVRIFSIAKCLLCNLYLVLHNAASCMYVLCSAQCVLFVLHASLKEEQSEVLAYTIHLEAHEKQDEASVTKV